MQIQLKELQKGKQSDKIGSQNLRNQIIEKQKKRKFQDVLKLSQEMPENVQKYLFACDAALQMKKWKDLLQFSEKGLQIESNSQFYHYKGKAMGKLGDDKKKIQLILKAIQLNPNVPAYHRNIGAAYYSIKQYEESIKYHHKSIDLEPNNASNYHNLGSAYFRLKDFQRAKIEFDTAIQKNPKQALSYSWKGDCLKEEQKLQEALQCYQKAYELTHSAIYLREKENLQEMIKKKNS